VSIFYLAAKWVDFEAKMGR